MRKNLFSKMYLNSPLVAFLMSFAVIAFAEIGIPPDPITDAQVKFHILADYRDNLAPSWAQLKLTIYRRVVDKRGNESWKLVETLTGTKKASSAKETYFALSSPLFNPMVSGPADFLFIASGRGALTGNKPYCFKLFGKQLEKVSIKPGKNVFRIWMDLIDRYIDCPKPLI